MAWEVVGMVLGILHKPDEAVAAAAGVPLPAPGASIS